MDKKKRLTMLSKVITVVACSVSSQGYVYIIVGVATKSESIRYMDPTGLPTEEPGATRLIPTSHSMI